MEQIVDRPFYYKKIKEIFEGRKARNPAYSLRAFAQSVAIDPGTMSRLLSAKVVPHYKLALKLVSNLKLSMSEEKDFLESVQKIQNEKNRVRQSGNFLFSRPRRLVEGVDSEIYESMNHWYDTAILELSEIKDYDFSPAVVAQDLGLTEAQAQNSIQRLRALKLLETRHGKVVKRNASLTTKNKETTTAALKENQRQFLVKALESLRDDPIEERSMTSIVMAVDPARLEVAKRMISDFNQALCAYLEKGQRTRVYNLSIALHPLQKNKDNLK